jgi:hypothetical protein
VAAIGKLKESCFHTASIERRHLTKSQIAMLVAMTYPDPTRDKRHCGDSPQLDGVDKSVLAQCRKILRLLPAAADAVIAGISLAGEVFRAPSISPCLRAPRPIR